MDSYNEMTTELAVKRTEVEELTGEKEHLDGRLALPGKRRISHMSSTLVWPLGASIDWSFTNVYTVD